jgi:copper chaperone CopZ
MKFKTQDWVSIIVIAVVLGGFGVVIHRIQRDEQEKKLQKLGSDGVRALEGKSAADIMGWQTRTFNLEGEKPPFWENGVTSAIMKVAGVKQVHVNPVTCIAVVSYDPAATHEEAIVTVINATNFKVKK